MKRPTLAGRAAAGLLVTASLLSMTGGPALAHRRAHAVATASPPPAVAAPAASSGPSPAEMLPALEAQLKATPHDANIALRLAEANLQAGHPERTLILCDQLIKAGIKNSAQVYFFQGAAYRAEGRFRESIAPFEAASNIDPTSALILVELSNAYLQSNRVDDAYRVAKRASTFNTRDARVFVNYGVVLAVRKQFDDARAQFETAAKLAPNETMPLVLEARTYLDQNRPDDAAKIYDAVLAKDPNNISALQGKEQIASAAHRVDEAVSYDERLYTVATDDVTKIQILNEEARLYLSEKQQAKADAVVQREVTAFPNLSLAHISAGDLAIAEGKEKEAVTQWSAALGPKQDDKVALMRLGMYSLRKNDPKNAVLMFSRITALDAKDDAAWFHLGQGYQLLNQFDHARDAFRHAFTIRQTVQAFADIGSCDYELHNYQEAARIFDALIAQATPFVNSNPNLLFIIAKTYDSANQKSKARSAYYRVLGFVKRGSSDEKTIRSLIANLNKPAAQTSHKAVHK